MTRAHLLIQSGPGTSQALRRHLERIPGVIAAAQTSGPFDAVAQVAVADEDQLQRVLAATRQAPGLARLCLCRSSP
jgi:DNA-binding Lrp family transcriptional regulator